MNKTDDGDNKKDWLERNIDAVIIVTNVFVVLVLLIHGMLA